MLKKLICFLQILAILFISKAFSINKQALEYLEKLRQKEYTALKHLCVAGKISELRFLNKELKKSSKFTKILNTFMPRNFSHKKTLIFSTIQN